MKATIFKALALGALLSTSLVPLSVSAESEVYQMPTDTRIVAFNYHPQNTFTLITRPKAATDIQLGKDEELVAFIMGDTVQWEADQVPGHIFIKPHKADLFNSATLVTTKRTYQLTLRSSGDKGRWYQAVSWRYPQDIRNAQIKQQAAQQQQQAVVEAEQRRLDANSAGKISSSPENLNFDYKISGKASFRPTQVFDDGKFTWLRIEGSQDMPALFMIDNDGETKVVNYVVKGEFLVIQQIVKGVLLKLGDDEVKITNRKG